MPTLFYFIFTRFVFKGWVRWRKKKKRKKNAIHEVPNKKPISSMIVVGPFRGGNSHLN